MKHSAGNTCDWMEFEWKLTQKIHKRVRVLNSFSNCVELLGKMSLLHWNEAYQVRIEVFFLGNGSKAWKFIFSDKENFLAKIVFSISFFDGQYSKEKSQQ